METSGQAYPNDLILGWVPTSFSAAVADLRHLE